VLRNKLHDDEKKSMEVAKKPEKSFSKLYKNFFPSEFRVEASVTRRSPHSPVREDFPHSFTEDNKSEH
jgi:hypothetical protein